jgi:hypothetical protein
VATFEQVEDVLADLLLRLRDLDPDVRALLPSRRTIRASCPDLELDHWAEWRNGDVQLLAGPPNGRRADIRVVISSDDLVQLHRGELRFTRAFAENRVRIDASVTDLLRLRALL